MASLSNYAENAVLNHITGKAALALPSTYVALFTTAPGEGTAGTEVSGGSYVRVAATAKFGTAANGVITTTADIEWPTASGAWGTIVAAALMDAATGGNILVYGPAATSKLIESGDTYRIPAGSFTITMD